MATSKKRKTGRSNKELGIKVVYSAMVKIYLPTAGQCAVSFSDGKMSISRSFRGHTKIYYIDLVEADKDLTTWMQNLNNSNPAN